MPCVYPVKRVMRELVVPFTLEGSLVTHKELSQLGEHTACCCGGHSGDERNAVLRILPRRHAHTHTHMMIHPVGGAVFVRRMWSLVRHLRGQLQAFIPPDLVSPHGWTQSAHHSFAGSTHGGEESVHSPLLPPLDAPLSSPPHAWWTVSPFSEFSHVSLLEDQVAVLRWYEGVLEAEWKHRQSLVRQRCSQLQSCSVTLLTRRVCPRSLACLVGGKGGGIRMTASFGFPDCFPPSLTLLLSAFIHGLQGAGRQDAGYLISSMEGASSLGCWARSPCPSIVASLALGHPFVPAGAVS